jgi:hypothetical protein
LIVKKFKSYTKIKRCTTFSKAHSIPAECKGSNI